MIVQCDSCPAEFDVSGKKPGAVFKCPKCQGGRIRVPLEELSLDAEIEELPAAAEEVAEIEEMEEVEDAAAPPPRPGRAGTRSRRPAPSGGARRPAGRRTRQQEPAAEKRGGLKPLVIAEIALGVIILGVGGWYLFGRGGDTAGDDGRFTTQDTPVKQQTTAEIYREHLAALGKADAVGRAELAAFCAEKGMADEATRLNREALLLDPYNASARLALGFQKYEGPATRYQGRWLSKTDLGLAKAAERFAVSGTLEGATTSEQVFMREADAIKRGMMREFPEDRWLYAYGDALMQRPFFVVIERKGKPEQVDEYRKEYSDTLATLYEAFYERYQQMFGLEEIERPIRVVMFDSQRSYSTHRANHPEKNYSDPAFIGGYYMPSEQQLIMWRQNGLRGVLFHEGTHMFVHYAFSGRGFEPSSQSPWFQEGFAEYFGGYKIETEMVDGKKKKTFKLGEFLPTRYMQYMDLVSRGRALKVIDLVKLNSYQFNKAKEDQGDQDPAKAAEGRDIIANVYGNGWAFVMYLNNARGGIYRRVFDEYFKREVNGAGHWGSIAELMSLENDQDWEDLNEDFRQWAQNELPKSAKRG